MTGAWGQADTDVLYKAVYSQLPVSLVLGYLVELLEKENGK